LGTTQQSINESAQFPACHIAGILVRLGSIFGFAFAEGALERVISSRTRRKPSLGPRYSAPASYGPGTNHPPQLQPTAVHLSETIDLCFRAQPRRPCR